MEDPRRDPRLVDWPRVGRRVGWSALVATAVVLVGWTTAGLAGAGFGVAALGTWLGAGVAVMLLAELVVVGGSALRGMLRAGERGERLAAPDVGLLPPRRRRRR